MTDAWRDYRASSNLAAPTILSCGGIGRHSGLKTHGPLCRKSSSLFTTTIFKVLVSLVKKEI